MAVKKSKKARAAKEKPAKEPGVSTASAQDEKLALQIVRVYFEEVARHGFKKSLWSSNAAIESHTDTSGSISFIFRKSSYPDDSIMSGIKGVMPSSE